LFTFTKIFGQITVYIFFAIFWLSRIISCVLRITIRNASIVIRVQSTVIGVATTVYRVMLIASCVSLTISGVMRVIVGSGLIGEN